jgi:hypothetical protein
VPVELFSQIGLGVLESREVLGGAVDCLPQAVQAAARGRWTPCFRILTARFVASLFRQSRGARNELRYYRRLENGVNPGEG